MTVLHPDLVLALLHEARAAGIAPLLRTTFVKYLYLLDVYFAEENQGRTVSEWKWQFLHFGPYSTEAASTLDKLVADHRVVMDARENQAGDKEFFLYDLPPHAKEIELPSLGISGSVRLKIQADMKRYGRNLPGLLDYVYFRTAPMSSASPGDVLDFSNCTRFTIEDVRSVAMQPLQKQAVARVRGRLVDLIQKRRSLPGIEQGPIDEVYEKGMQLLDGTPTGVGVKGEAKINVK